MRIRSPSDKPPFSIAHSELYEAAAFALVRQFPNIDEGLQAVEWALARDPYNQGEPFSALGDRQFHLMKTAATRRYPSLRILFEISSRTVFCWHVSVRLD